MRALFGFIWACLLLLSVVTAAAAADRLTVYTVNYPLQYFAQRIAGDHADVVFPAPGDIDPAFWQPEADEIAAFQQADLILLNGAGYAKWVDRVALPRRRLVDTSAGFRDRYIKVEGAVTHSHGPGGDHSHAGTAFTTWLDPTLALEQAKAIHEALVRIRPGLKGDFDTNLAALEDDLLGLDRRLATVFEASSGQRFVASHPIYQYLQRRYDLDLHILMWEPGEDPGDAEWSALEKTLAQRPAGWMIWEGEPLPASVERLGALGVRSLVFSPAGNRPEQGDYLDVMRSNLENLEQALN